MDQVFRCYSHASFLNITVLYCFLFSVYVYIDVKLDFFFVALFWPDVTGILGSYAGCRDPC